MAGALGFEPRRRVLETLMLAINITPLCLIDAENYTRNRGFEKVCVEREKLP